MTDVDKLVMLRGMTGEENEEALITYLGIAGDKICRKAYPFSRTVKVVPEQYGFVQVEIAAYLLNKRGAEGQTAHSENGITRTYENADIPSTLLRDIIPYASPIGGRNEDTGTE